MLHHKAALIAIAFEVKLSELVRFIIRWMQTISRSLTNKLRISSANQPAENKLRVYQKAPRRAESAAATG
jgi:hypothetical protein